METFSDRLKRNSVFCGAGFRKKKNYLTIGKKIQQLLKPLKFRILPKNVSTRWLVNRLVSNFLLSWRLFPKAIETE